MNVDTDMAFNGIGHPDEAATAKDFFAVRQEGARQVQRQICGSGKYLKQLPGKKQQDFH